MKSLMFPLAIAAVAGLLTTGCSNKVVFATHTSLGLDVSGTAEVPDHVSLSYDREEAAIVPRKADGQAHSVYGGLDTDISWWHGSVIKQTFATGEAAKIATNPETEVSTDDTDNDSTKPLVFVTGTTFGLHLSAGQGQIKPDLLMGYRRGEAAYIPVPDPNQEVRSVYADLLINSKSSPSRDSGKGTETTITTEFPSDSGVRIKQSFATGVAAENLARTKDVRTKLAAAAGISPQALADKAATEAAIEDRVRNLPAGKQNELFQWADTTFPDESQGQLAARASVPHFVNAFLPQLDAEGQQAVVVKLNQLEN
ncbi:MAG: hypothetical protein H7A46_02680 [Verrucomicrobiales bacterium]|nr:hypothetical protein [Verrucomicrobiales bacterium]